MHEPFDFLKLRWGELNVKFLLPFSNNVDCLTEDSSKNVYTWERRRLKTQMLKDCNS